MTSMAVYLGDSVYANFDGFHVRLFTDNGMGPKNEIFLEDQVLNKLFEFVGKVYGVQVIVKKEPK